MERRKRTIWRCLFRAILLIGAILGTIEASYAITNGQPDGDGHPYVGAVHNGVVFGSGALISPNIFITAAHCFNYPGERVWVTFDPEPFALGNEPIYYMGTWYPHPDFCLDCKPGLPGSDTNDVAVVELDEPVYLDEYAELPTEGLVDTLPMGTEVSIVGYGVQLYVTGGGPRKPVFLRARYYAPSMLIASHHKQSDEYIKLTENPAQGKGGICFGDSGGPDLLENGGAATILAINSYGTNNNCTGVSYSNRIDIESALDFIYEFLSP